MRAELGVYLLAGATLLAAVIGAAGAVWAAMISRENRRKLTTPSDGTIGQQVQNLTEK